VYTPTWEYKDDEVAELSDVIDGGKKKSLKRMEKVRQTSSKFMTATVW
jgi:hypothetical protein